MQQTGKRGLPRRVFGSLALVVAAFAVIWAGCYPGQIESVQELDLVLTLFDKDADFTALKTYSIADSIIHICEVEVEDQPQNCPNELTRLYDNLILSQIEDNLRDAGFTKSADPQQADVFVVVAANATDNYGASSYYPWYWGSYYPGYPGWGWYYPPVTTVYEYTTGTLTIAMFDPDKAETASKQLGGVWVAAVNGLLGEGGNPQTRITTAINQAFQQSPYLGAGK